MIANDSYAMTFQAMGQYRTALLSHFDNLVDQPSDDFAARAERCLLLQPQAPCLRLGGDQQDSAQVAALAKPGGT